MQASWHTQTDFVTSEMLALKMITPRTFGISDTQIADFIVPQCHSHLTISGPSPSREYVAVTNGFPQSTIAANSISRKALFCVSVKMANSLDRM